MSNHPPKSLSDLAGPPAASHGSSHSEASAPSQPRVGFFRTSPLRGGSLASTNRFAYNTKSGKQLGPGLVDETGMGGRLHQMHPSAFLDTVPGPEPTLTQRHSFVKPVVGKEVNSERKLAVIFVKSMQSVLNVAQSKTLRVVDTASHKAKDGDDQPTDTLNDVGFYLDTPRSRAATDLTSEQRQHSKIPQSEQEARNLGRRSWHWLVVPVELKWNATSAFYAKGKSSKAESKVASDGQKGNTARAPSVDVGSNGGSGEAALLWMLALEAHYSPAISEHPAESLSSTNTPDVFAVAQGVPHTAAETAESPSASASHISASTPADPVEGKQFIRDTADGEIALGQFAEYQFNVFTHQHRCFLYGIYVCKRGARMIYSDRTGTRVSEEFDWTDDNSFLHRFVWKLAHMSLEELGYDPTAELATDSQCRQLKLAKGDNTLQPHVVDVVNNAFDKHYPVYKLRITISEPLPDELFPANDPVILPPSMSELASPTTPPEQQAKEHEFLVARPHFHTDALVGRCTKCYIAYDIEGRRFCFLKDYWRPLVANRSRPEHLVYNRLHSVGTPFIPTLICGGDVGGPRRQMTQVQDSLPSKGRPVPRIHYRIAIAEIARPLETFNDFTELAYIFAHVIGAHDHAVKHAGILHRDISAGNIMIDSDPRPRGLLIDWDLSRLVSELGTGPIEPERTGTWPFQSALIQRWPRKPYCVSDDIESFIHVFLYMVLRYHVVDIPDLYDFVSSYFESFATVRVVFGDQVWMVKRGGHSKWRQLKAPTSAVIVEDNPRLQQLLEDIAYGCYTSYSTITVARMNEAYGLPKDPIDRNDQQVQHSHPPSDDLDLSTMGGPLLMPKPPSSQVSSEGACEVSGFLADAGQLREVFKQYVSDTKDAERVSKAPDQFKARDGEQPKFRYIAPLPNRRISALSKSYTPSSSMDSPVFLACAATGSSSPDVTSSPIPPRDPSLRLSGPSSRATSPGLSAAPSSNEPSREASPLPGAPPILAGSSSEGDEPSENGALPEILGKRRGRTSDVADAAYTMTSETAAVAVSKGILKPLKQRRR
ncbi:hypothetical protein ONZ51_g12598 [Trametes cubensis]|uniref:Fungal-type protein kinase domain-containing protein n=1 Tax=Trametes cubensis TaxID=1111947 RepID=A0AAD7TFQ4_9APHY|nr:hypothetical protein ONZ51_g12598 [Trametes cubensis]